MKIRHKTCDIRQKDNHNTKGDYYIMDTNIFAEGSIYGPLQTDGHDYLCPDCGGYGFIHDKDNKCIFCNGEGTIALNDKRIVVKENH